MNFKRSVSLLLPIVLLYSCLQKQNNSDPYQPKEYVELKHPDWTKNATIYEVNVRQYTNEGTFKAFESHLPRLKEMGIDIIWLMPIHPIGIEKRKGSLGSEYSVKDYYGVNPEYGTLEDLKALVKKIHGMGMHVILDWVANHSSWDNALTKEHPDWYTKTPEGNFQPTPWYDWDDVVDFDYNVPAMREYMTGAMKYWVKEADIDGYRCDVAGFIPVDFWDNTRKELDAIKPVFMLAEWESRDLYKHAFDMTYAWTLFNELKKAAHGENLGGLTEYLAHDVNSVPTNAYRMTFTDNHDMNSWNHNQFYNFGPALKTCIAFCTAVNGMPLVYSGQEAGLDHSLRFFDKDTIQWKEHEFYGLYKKLFELKHTHQALWNGNWGGPMQKLINDQPQVISFYREKEKDRVVAIFNFSDKVLKTGFKSQYIKGEYADFTTGQKITLSGSDTLELQPWDHKLLIK